MPFSEMLSSGKERGKWGWNQGYAECETIKPDVE
jgi:hypothetical protein